jgi:hypothetical protein
MFAIFSRRDPKSHTLIAATRLACPADGQKLAKNIVCQILSCPENLVIVYKAVVASIVGDGNRLTATVKDHMPECFCGGR